jgi:hypothetical protein
LSPLKVSQIVELIQQWAIIHCYALGVSLDRTTDSRQGRPHLYRLQLLRATSGHFGQFKDQIEAARMRDGSYRARQPLASSPFCD